MCSVVYVVLAIEESNEQVSILHPLATEVWEGNGLLSFLDDRHGAMVVIQKNSLNY